MNEKANPENEPVLGYWWRPNNLDDKRAGLLRNVGGNIHELEVLSDLKTFHFANASTMHGEAHGELYTLLHCSPVEAHGWLKDSDAGIEVTQAREVIRGSHLESPDELFESIAFTIEAGQSWSQISGIRQTRIQHENSPTQDVLIERKSPNSIHLAANQFSVELRPIVDVPSSNWSAMLQEDTLFVITSNIPLSLGQWKDLILVPLRGLIQFATKYGGTSNRAAARPKDPKRRRIEDYGLDVRLPWTAEWMTQYPFTEIRSHAERPLFLAMSLVDHPDALSKWFELFTKRREALTSVLDLSLGSPSVEFRFFAAARLFEQLADRYSKSPVETHPYNHNGEAWNRLVRLLTYWQGHLEPLKSNPNIIPWAARRVVKTRNCFAHHKETTCREAANGHQLLCFEAFVRTLIDCEICLALGLPQEMASQTLAASKQYRLGQDIVSYFIREQAEPE